MQKTAFFASWWWRAVLLPFLITRLALLVVGWYALELRPDSDYPNRAAVSAGWEYSPHRWLDIWGRWDSAWYMGIAQHGYQPVDDYSTQQSNLAFFPLYPFTVRALAAVLPGTPQTQVMLLLGMLLSNLCLLGSLALLYQLSLDAGSDRDAAERSVYSFVLFPAAFFFACFYSESLFFFLLLLAFWAAGRKRWAIAGAAGGLAILARSPGLLAAPALAWLYAEQRDWQPRRLGWQSLWLLLLPAGLLSFLAIGYAYSGDWLVYFHANAAWQRSLTWPWVTLFAPLDNSRPHFNQLEWVSLAGFTLLSLYILLKRPAWRSYSIYALLLMLTLLTSGTLTSVTRVCATLFPVFMLLGQWGQRYPALERGMWIIFATLQALLFAGWCQFYWAG